MKQVQVLPDTIKQLESLKENSQSFIDDKDNSDDGQIWKDDIVALDNAIEIIKDYQELKEKTIIILPKRWNGSEWKFIPKEEASEIFHNLLKENNPALVREAINYKGEDTWACGKCGTGMWKMNQPYCSGCGTKTDWSDMHKLLDDPDNE